MTTDLATKEDPMTAFKEKLSERVRQDIGELIPEAAIQQMVDTVIQKEFFRPLDDKTPNPFVSVVIKQSMPIIEKAIQQYIDRNKEMIQTQIEQFVSQHNIALLLSAAMSRHLQDSIYDKAYQIVEATRRPHY